MRPLILVLTLVSSWAFGAEPAPAPKARWEEPLALTPLQPDKAPEKNVGAIAVGTSASARWVWKHGGTKPFVVESITAEAPFAVNGQDCSGEWAPGRTCEIQVRFEPKEPGAYAGTIRVAIKGPYEETQILFRATGAGLRPARVEMDGETAFGNVLVGQSAEKEVSLRNTGEMPASALALRVSGNGFQASGCGPTLSPGQSCTAKVRFLPKEPGSQSAVLTAQFQSGAGNGAAERRLAGAGLRAARLTLHVPGAGNLGRQILGTTAFFDVTVANSGDLPAKNLEVSTNWSSPFTFKGNKYPGEGGDCGKELAPRATCRLSVQSAPLFPGPVDQAFGIRYHDGAAAQVVNRTVKAEGITPARLALREKSGEFDQRLINTPLEQRFHIVNEGQGEATSIRLVPTGGFTAGFELKGAAKEGASCGTTLVANAECEFVVRFASKAAGTFDAGLSVVYQNGLAEQSLKFPFRAKALAPAKLVFEPATPLDFGELVTEQNKVEFVTVKNIGDIATDKFVVAPIQPPYTFKWDSRRNSEADVCGKAVHGGRKCIFQVAYAPLKAGTDAAEIKMSYFDGFSDQAVVLPLKGKGLSPAKLELAEQAPIDFGVGLVSGNAERVLKFKNTGDLPAMALNTEIPGGQKAAFFNAQSTCMERLDAGKECTVRVGFAPNRKGVLDGEVKLSYANGRGSLVETPVALKGEGKPTANLVFREQQKVDFGRRLVGQTEAVTMLVTNDGETPAAKIEGKFQDGKKGFAFKGGKFPGDGGDCPVPLEPGKVCKLVVAFAPAAAGEPVESFTVTYDNGAKPAKAVSQLTGRAAAPGKLVVSTATVDFGTRVIGSKSSQSFELKNTGGDAIELSLEKLALPEGFALREGSCGKRLTAGQGCKGEVEFAPAKDLTVTEKLKIAYTDQVTAELREEILLKGNGRAPAQLTFTPEKLPPFGQVFVGDTREETVQIKNAGGVEAAVEVLTAQVPGFTVTHTCPARLAPAGTCAAKMKFVPTAASEYGNRFAVHYNDGLTKQEKELETKGQGMLPAELRVARKQVDFGRYPVGKSTSRKVKIENAGTVEAISMQATAPAAPFRWQGGSYPGTDGDCGSSLAPGADCSISLEFVPVAQSDADGQVEIRYQDGRGPKSIALDLKGKVEAAPRDLAAEKDKGN